MTHDSRYEYDKDQDREPEQAASAPVADPPGESTPAGRVMVRHRPHRFPGRDRVVKVRYTSRSTAPLPSRPRGPA